MLWQGVFAVLGPVACWGVGSKLQVDVGILELENMSVKRECVISLREVSLDG